MYYTIQYSSHFLFMKYYNLSLSTIYSIPLPMLLAQVLHYDNLMYVQCTSKHLLAHFVYLYSCRSSTSSCFASHLQYFIVLILCVNPMNLANVLWYHPVLIGSGHQDPESRSYIKEECSWIWLKERVKKSWFQINLVFIPFFSYDAFTSVNTYTVCYFSNVNSWLN